jgi:membrane fusion protein (multidrug efflux system)
MDRRVILRFARKVKTGKQLAIVGALSAVAAGGYLLHDRVLRHPTVAQQQAKSLQAPGRLVETAKVHPHRIETRIEGVGTSLARRSIDVVPLTTGRIRAIRFEAGQRVKVGQVLTELDDEIERADLAEAEAALTQTRLALQRAETLQMKKHVPEATVEDLRSKVATAAAAVDRAKRRSADRSIRAPFSGVVGIRRVDVGARVDDQSVITTLDDLAEIQIEFSVPEQVYSRVRAGQPAQATSATFPGRIFEGKVALVDSRIDATSRSFKVRVTVPNPDLVLPAGMFMHVQLTLESREVLTVPEEAVIPEAGAAYVFVVENGRSHRRKVTLGRRDVGLVEISKGLALGEEVVVKGLASLREGTPVRVVGAEETDS